MIDNLDGFWYNLAQLTVAQRMASEGVWTMDASEFGILGWLLSLLRVLLALMMQPILALV